MGLKVTNSLHHLSIKSGIQVLRQNNFSPSCLKRRPAPDEVRTRAVCSRVTLTETDTEPRQMSVCSHVTFFSPGLLSFLLLSE